MTTRIIVKGEGMIGERAHRGRRSAAVRCRRRCSAPRRSRRPPTTPSSSLRRPIAGGEIVDPTAARWLVNHAMVRAAGRQRIFKPDVVIAVMSTLAGSQRRSLLEAAALAGARTVYLLDAPLASAMGAGVRLNGPNGHLVDRHRRGQDRHRRARTRGDGQRPLSRRPWRRAPARLRGRPRSRRARRHPRLRPRSRS